MHEPAVSILVTAFNREQYIAETLKSVLSSAFQDFEVVVVDDRSQDGTLEIAQQFARRDSRVRVYQNDRNLGDYPNRNRAARLARGKYLKYVDSDDILYPHGLGVMVDAMERFSDAALGISRGAAREFPYPVQLSPEEAFRQHYLGSGLFGHGPLGVIIRADAFREVGGFSGRRYVGDTELWSRLAARFPVVLLPPGLTWWRQHEGQEFSVGQYTGAYPRLKFQASVEALNHPDCPLPQVARDQALARIYREYSRAFAGLLKRGRVSAALRLYRQGGVPLRELVKGIR